MSVEIGGINIASTCDDKQRGVSSVMKESPMKYCLAVLVVAVVLIAEDLH